MTNFAHLVIEILMQKMLVVMALKILRAIVLAVLTPNTTMLLIVIGLIIIIAVLSCGSPSALVATEQTHIIDEVAPAVLLAEQGEKLQHQLIICHVALREDALNLLEVPLWKPQRFDILRWASHVLILAIRSVDAKATPVIIALTTDRPSWIVIFSCYIALTDITISTTIHVITIACFPLLTIVSLTVVTRLTGLLLEYMMGFTFVG